MLEVGGLSSNHWIRISEIGYFIFVVVVAVVLISTYRNNLGIAALLGAGSFVGLSLLGWFIFEKVLPEH
jgi:hypothetical protein